MKRPTGRIEYREDTSISYSAAGRNPPRPWVVIIDSNGVNGASVGVVDRDKTYAWAAVHLAHELTWRDPEILKLVEKLEERKKEIRLVHLQRLTASRPDQDNTNPEHGRHQTYEGAPWVCGLCYRHEDHETIELAHMHGCNR